MFSYLQLQRKRTRDDLEDQINSAHQPYLILASKWGQEKADELLNVLQGPIGGHISESRKSGKSCAKSICIQCRDTIMKKDKRCPFGKKLWLRDSLIPCQIYDDFYETLIGDTCSKNNKQNGVLFDTGSEHNLVCFHFGKTCNIPFCNQCLYTKKHFAHEIDAFNNGAELFSSKINTIEEWKK